MLHCANQGIAYDEARLDYLLACMDFNPQYHEQLENERIKWQNTIAPFADECLETMRSFIPPHIFFTSVQSLQNDANYSLELSKRLMTKKCLWLVRVTVSDIERLHIAELQGK